MNGDTLSLDAKPRRRRPGVRAPRIMHRSSFLAGSSGQVLVLAQLEVGAEEAGTRIRILNLSGRRRSGTPKLPRQCDKFDRELFLSDLKLLVQPRWIKGSVKTTLRPLLT